MKRRDFVKGSALTVVGAGLLGSADTFAGTAKTYLESEDIAPDASLRDEKYDLHFLAIGDWGRNGADHQLQVARQMGRWATDHPNDFIVSVGDNFYPSGVTSEHDPLWHYSYENVYTEFKLQWDWYPILGNHDYKSDPDAQVRYSAISRRWKMPSRYYAKELSLGAGKGKVLMLFIDTNPLIPEFYANKEYGPHVKGQAPEKQLAWIEEMLKNAASDVKWKIVVGHHPIYTVGPRIRNYDTLAVRKVLRGLFQKYKADLYLSGHDHSLQHLKTDDFTHHFISGAGSEVTPVSSGVEYSRFEASDYGFMYFSLNSHKISVKVINHEGRELYVATLNK